MSAVIGVWCRVAEMRPDATTAEWSLLGTGTPGIEVVDSLARMQLEARRCGGRVRLLEVSEDLAALLELAGLGREVLGRDGRQVSRQAEGGEDAGGVEEAVPVREPAVNDLEDL